MKRKQAFPSWNQGRYAFPYPAPIWLLESTLVLSYPQPHGLFVHIRLVTSLLMDHVTPCSALPILPSSVNGWLFWYSLLLHIDIYLTSIWVLIGKQQHMQQFLVPRSAEKIRCFIALWAFQSRLSLAVEVSLLQCTFYFLKGKHIL